MPMKLPKETKWILIALAVLVVLVVVYFFWSKTDKAEKIKESNAAIDRANKEIDVNQLTITDEQADALADKFYNALIGPGTDIDAVWDAIGYCKTRSDIIKVAATYKLRHGDSWFSSGSLWQDLTDDLSSDEIKEFNKILEYKNVEFRI